MSNIISIGKRKIGKDYPAFIIAEAGSNWHISKNDKKNYRQALKLIDIAAQAKADAVKFQLFKAEKLYPSQAGQADYLKNKKTIYEIIKTMELPDTWLRKLKIYSEKRGLIFLCTPFDEESVDKLEAVGILAYKIASYTISHLPLIKYIAQKKKPIILSTGAADEKDIKKALTVMEKTGKNQVALLQCTAKYPAPLSTLNLKAVPVLAKKFKTVVGLSDHSRDPLIGPLGTVALGGRIIEKHFTLDNDLTGPDHKFAILGHELKEMVTGIRMMEEALGTGKKDIQPSERELYLFCRRMIFAKRDIKKGELLNKDNLIALRPGKQYDKEGILAENWEKLMGKKAQENIQKYELIKKSFI